MKFILSQLILVSLISCSTRSQNHSPATEPPITKDSLKYVYSNRSSATPGFDCNKFNYHVSSKYNTDKNGFPTLSKKDSADLVEYALKHNHLKFALYGKDTVLWRLFYLIPRIRGAVNTELYDSLIDHRLTSFNGLTNPQMYDLTNSDAVILGEVKEKRLIMDSTRCFYYRTEFVIKVEEILHSYFPLKNNSEVLLKSMTGYIGGCDLKNRWIRDKRDIIREFEVGDRWIFFLNHNEYYSKFLFRIRDPKTSTTYFADEYCPNSFGMYNGNDLYNSKNDTLINSIKLFYKTLFKN